eukprot:m.1585412 g.1585412  ORF g.1585412 m.1585412 type:complete len:2501 (+) comp25324_c0_seq5:242-7744(+)
MLFWTQFHGLLRKNFLRKKRNPIWTAVELLLPLLFFFLLIALRSFLTGTKYGQATYDPLAVPSAGLLPLFQSFLCGGVPEISHGLDSQESVSALTTAVEIFEDEGIANLEQFTSDLAGVLAILSGVDDSVNTTENVFRSGILASISQSNTTCTSSSFPLLGKWTQVGNGSDFWGLHSSQSLKRKAVACTCDVLSSEFTPTRSNMSGDGQSFHREINDNNGQNSSNVSFYAAPGACNVESPDGIFYSTYDYLLYVGNRPFSSSACATLCYKNANCTGFEYPAGGRYCWLWLYGACSGTWSDGFTKSKLYTTYYLPAYGSPEGTGNSNSTISQLLGYLNSSTIRLLDIPIARALVRIFSLPQYQSIAESPPKTITDATTLLCGASAPSPTAAPVANATAPPSPPEDPENRDVAKDPVQARVSQLSALFAGSVINYAPNTTAVARVIQLANRTFDALATVYSMYACVRAVQDARIVQSGDPGLVIDRWLTVGGGLNTRGMEMLRSIPPDGTWVLGGRVFATPYDVGNHFASRIRGVFTPQETGPHAFWIRSDDVGVLYFGEEPQEGDISNAGGNVTEEIAAMRLIASCPVATGGYTRSKSQKSQPLHLIAGKSYRIHAITMDSTNHDYLNVAVVLPSGQLANPIPVMPFLSMPYPIVPVVLPAPGTFANASAPTVHYSKNVTLESDPGVLAAFSRFNLFQGYSTVSEMNAVSHTQTFREGVFSVGKQVLAALDFSEALTHDNESWMLRAVNPSVTIRMRGGLLPSTSLGRLPIGTYWGEYTWYFYYYSGFIWLQDIVTQGIFSAQNWTKYTNNFIQKMPTPAYTADIFVDINTIVFPYFVLLSWMGAIALAVNTIVDERERRLEEALSLMGLTQTATVASWIVFLGLFWGLPNILLSILLIQGNIFPQSSGVLIFCLFQLFSFANTGFALIVSHWFTSSKTGAAASALFYMLGFVPYFTVAINPDLVSESDKFLYGLFPPTAVALTMPYFANGEYTGNGVHFHNMGQSLGSCDTFSMSKCFAALATSAILLNGIAWLQRVDRDELREYWQWWSRLYTRKAEGIAVDDPYVSPVTLHNVSKTYSRVDVLGCHRQRCTALRDVSFELPRGKITVLLGLNGAGKSTTMDLITGVRHPTSGRVTVHGTSGCRTDRTHAAIGPRGVPPLGVCPQYNILYPSLTVRDHVRLVGSIRGLPLAETVAQAQDIGVELDLWRHADVAARKLSGGMQRKLSLMLSMLGHPDVLLLDEPTAGMDPSVRQSVWKVLRQQRNAGATVLISTHHMDEAEALADNVLILSNGTVRCEGSSMELKEKATTKYVLVLYAQTGTMLDPRRVHAFVSAHVADGTVRDCGLKHITYVLPASWRAKDEFLCAFADEKEQLGLLRAEIFSSSLEDVFFDMLEPDAKAAVDDVGIAINARAPGDSDDDMLSLDVCERSPPAPPQEPDHATSGDACNSEDDLLLGPPPANAATPFHGDPESMSRAGTMSLPWKQRVGQRARAILRKRWRILRRDPQAHASHLWLPLLFAGLAVAMDAWLSPSTQEDPLVLSPTLYENTCPHATSAPVNIIPYYCGNMSCELVATRAAKGLYSTTMLNVTDWWQQLPTSDKQQPSASMLPNGQVMNDYYLATTTPHGNGNVHGGLSLGHTPSVDNHTVLAAQRWLSGATLSESNAGYTAAWFESRDAHSLPIYLALLQNAVSIASNQSSAHPAGSVTIINYPLEKNAAEILAEHEAYPISQAVAVLLIMAMSFPAAGTLAFFVLERASLFKHLQIFGGIESKQYWLFHEFCDAVVVAPALCIICILLGCSTASGSYEGHNLSAAMLLLIMYHIAMLPVAGLLSLRFTSPTVAYVAMVVLAVTTTALCVFSRFLLNELERVAPGAEAVEVYIHQLIYFIPGYTCGDGLINLCDAKYKYDFEVQRAEIAGESTPVAMGPLEWGVTGKNLFLLLAQTCCFQLVLFLVEHRWGTCARSTKSARSDSHVHHSADNDSEGSDDDDDADTSIRLERGCFLPDQDNSVLAEEARCQAFLSDSAQADATPPVLVYRFVKVYRGAWTRWMRWCPWEPLRSCFGRCIPKRVVTDISFSVQPFSCFGLLGVNGAGKTTTFRALTGELTNFQGQVLVGGENVQTGRFAHRAGRWCGYCPQQGGLSLRLTVRETLALFLDIRRSHGLAMETTAEQTIRDSLQHMNLVEHAEKLVQHLSYGNRRKLNVAIALLGDPQVLLLDEPTTGLDPAARRFLWTQITGASRRGAAVVLTTHSMDECERLCDRNAIMLDGRVRALGSAHDLRARFGRGCVVRAAVPSTPQESSDTVAPVPGSTTPAARVLAALQEMSVFSECTILPCDNASQTHVSDTSGAAPNAAAHDGKRLVFVEGCIPHDALTDEREQLRVMGQVHALLDALVARGDVSSYDIRNSSLDEVFCRFAAEQHRQTQPTNDNSNNRRVHPSTGAENSDDTVSIDGDVPLLHVGPSDLRADSRHQPTSGVNSAYSGGSSGESQGEQSRDTLL